MDKPRNYYKGTYHHLYNKGANKQNIFYERANYIYFIEKIKLYKDKYKIDILAYCLMPNHFHLFVTQHTNEHSISGFISSLLNSYTKSINKIYHKNGTLFGSKTKNKEIKDEFYFKWVIKYILENPVKAGLAKKIGDWEFSCAKELVYSKKECVTNINEVKTFFQSEEQMKQFLCDENIKVIYEV